MIGVAPDQQSFLGFEVNGVYYVYTALPFGLSVSPYVFTRVVKVFATFLRRPVFPNGLLFSASFAPRKFVREGFACLVYLDDILILLRADGGTKVRLRLLFLILDCFGVAINHAKSDFRPRRVREHLGIILDLRTRSFSVSDAKLHKLRGQAAALARWAAAHKRWVPKQQLAQFTGYVISLSVAIPTARFHLLPLYDTLN